MSIAGELDSTVDQQLNDSEYFQQQAEQLALAESRVRRYRRMADAKSGDKNQPGGFSKALDWIPFHGDDDDDAEEFMEKFDFNCEKYGVTTDEAKLKRLHLLAKGGFKDFLKTLKEECIQGDETKDYSKFSNVLGAFNSHYLGEERMKTNKGKLGSITQEYCTIEEYASRMQEIFSKLPNSYMSSGAKLDRFIDNLKPVFKEYLIEQNPKSLSSAIQIAKRKERALAALQSGTKGTAGKTRYVNAVDAVDPPVASIEVVELRKQVESLSGSLAKLVEVVTNNAIANASSSSGYRGNRPRPIANGPETRTCFKCGVVGHLKPDCDRIKAEQAAKEKQSKSVSFGKSTAASASGSGSKSAYKMAKIQALLAAA